MRVVAVLALLFALLGGCAPLVVAGVGAAGGAAWTYEYRSCKLADGRWVNRHWASLHPNLARCFR